MNSFIVRSTLDPAYFTIVRCRKIQKILVVKGAFGTCPPAFFFHIHMWSFPHMAGWLRKTPHIDLGFFQEICNIFFEKQSKFKGKLCLDTQNVKMFRLRRAILFLPSINSILQTTAEKTPHVENHEKNRCYRVSRKSLIPTRISIFGMAG